MHVGRRRSSKVHIDPSPSAPAPSCDEPSTAVSTQALPQERRAGALTAVGGGRLELAPLDPALLLVAAAKRRGSAEGVGSLVPRSIENNRSNGSHGGEHVSLNGQNGAHGRGSLSPDALALPSSPRIGLSPNSTSNAMSNPALPLSVPSLSDARRGSSRLLKVTVTARVYLPLLTPSVV